MYIVLCLFESRLRHINISLIFNSLISQCNPGVSEYLFNIDLIEFSTLRRRLAPLQYIINNQNLHCYCKRLISTTSHFLLNDSLLFVYSNFQVIYLLSFNSSIIASLSFKLESRRFICAFRLSTCSFRSAIVPLWLSISV